MINLFKSKTDKKSYSQHLEDISNFERMRNETFAEKFLAFTIFLTTRIKELENIERIRVITEYLSSVPNINAGGCAVAAMLMQKYCGGNIIFGINSSVYNVAQMKNNIDNNEPVSCWHAFVEIDGKYYDSRGDTAEYSCGFNFTVDNMIVVNNNQYIISTFKTSGLWNPAFNEFYRNQLIQIIQDL